MRKHRAASAGVRGPEAGDGSISRWNRSPPRQAFPSNRFDEAAAIFAEAPRAIALCAEGIVRRPNGYHNVLKLIDLAWVTGKLGQPGCGVNTVTEEINEQGAVDMGVAPEFLPGQARFDDPTARRTVRAGLGCHIAGGNERGESDGDFGALPAAVRSKRSTSSEKILSRRSRLLPE